jgi:hypothetical protein
MMMTTTMMMMMMMMMLMVRPANAVQGDTGATHSISSGRKV